MSQAGQTINDRILAAKHSLAGQGLAKAVCKATTEEIIGPKKKHLDYLLHCTNEPNVSIPTLANLLIERTLNPSWVVVYKGLITIHHLMCYGNERFTQYLASSNSNFQLSNFLDKTGVQGYDMSPFIRRYAKYLSEKSVSYRTVALDFCKVKRGKDGGTLRTMTGDKLLKTLPVLQAQIDALLEFDCTSQDLNNGVINSSFMLLFRDLIRLFACYNDGVINLLEKYFDMGKKQARDALDLYKKFLIRMDRVAEFLKVAENVGIDKGDIPDLAKAPSSLLEALEGHLASLEGRKPGSGGTTPTQGGHRVNVAAAVNVLNTTSNAFGTAANGAAIDEKTAQKLLEEEAAAMEKFRENASTHNPFAAAPAAAAEETPNILDLFGVAAPTGAPAWEAPVDSAPAPVGSDKASDDLLQLAGNPFANMLNAAGTGSFPPAAAAAPPTSSPFMAPASAAGFGSVQSSTNTFVSDNSFSNVFGQPSSASTTGSAALFGDIMQPSGGTGTTNGSKDGAKVLTGDLDSSLANLASNLTFGPSGNKSLIGGAARGPPMAKPAGFNPFPQQQQMAGEVSFGQNNHNLTSPNPSQAPGIAFGSESSPFQDTSPFPNSASSPMFPSNTLLTPSSQQTLLPTMSSSQTFPNMTTSPNQAFPDFSLNVTGNSPAFQGSSPAFPTTSTAFQGSSPAFLATSTSFQGGSPAFPATSTSFQGGSPAFPASSTSFQESSPAFPAKNLSGFLESSPSQGTSNFADFGLLNGNSFTNNNGLPSKPGFPPNSSSMGNSPGLATNPIPTGQTSDPFGLL